MTHMDDATKAAADAALVESMVQQLRDCVSVGDEMTLDHATLIDDAADWIAGEPARQQAACDRRAENMREACAQALDTRSCCCDGIVREVPLTATPLGDEIAALRTENERLRAWVSTVAEALGAIEPVSDCRVELGAEAAAQMAEALRARVAELEAQLAKAAQEASDARRQRDQLHDRVARLEALIADGMGGKP